ncbi:probable insulin-like peptide 4 [Drosophila santomea]|uniref:probable insulin-like peptide 4 n=1 Tax=Drosophila santomea TaxID=129105 RepID=UPI00195360A2|nr:probable insulin-like peptide 4 [Drosophila santomea]
MMSLIRLGLALLLLLATVSHLLQPVQGRRKMCGEALIQALDVICVNGFTRRVRRSSASKDARVRELIRKLQQPDEDTERVTEMGRVTDKDTNTDTDMEMGEPPASGRGRRLRRHRRRIAHECCKEGCTYDDILDYCA